MTEPASRYTQTYKAGNPIDPAKAPRVLFLAWRSAIWGDVPARLAEVVPTVQMIDDPDKVNLEEWDCIITDHTLTELHDEMVEDVAFGALRPSGVKYWSQDFPPHLSFIVVTRLLGRRRRQPTLIDVAPPAGSGPNPAVMMTADHDTVGAGIATVADLPERLARLVQRDLVPVVRAREVHTTFSRKVMDAGADGLPFRPFLFGPSKSVLAGSYERNAGASVWLLPTDLPDLYPWIVEALREWHEDYPDRFPGTPEWPQNEAWRTAGEATLHAEMDAHQTAALETFNRLMREQAEIKARVDAAAAAADIYERALLTADGEALAEAVARALADLGFNVTDMDDLRPAQDRREDFRVTDDDDPGWVAVVEVKGALYGVKETWIQGLDRWVNLYLVETAGQMPSVRWLVANQHRRDDPASRPAPFGNKQDVIELLKQVDGLLLDTRALFDLLRLTAADPALKPAARHLVKSARGVLDSVTSADLTPPTAGDPANP